MKIKILLFLVIVFCIIAIAVLATGVYSVIVSMPLFDDTLAYETLGTIDIADAAEALTFARYRENGDLQVLLVSNYREGAVEGINLNKYFKTDQIDPVRLFNTYGYKKILSAATSVSKKTLVSAPELEIPFDAKGQHIGIGANYRAHAEESMAGDEPFVFPKTVEATHFTSKISKRGSPRLDYEAEVGFVALQDISSGTDFPQFMGLVLCNDFTARWTLVRRIKTKEPMGTTGFTDGKGKNSFLPIGNLFIIPYDLQAFYPEIKLNLYLNGRLRQSAKAGLMIWDPPEMIRQIFLRSNWEFHSDNGTVPLLPEDGKISEGTIILSGTPAGVIFRPVNLWNPGFYLDAGDDVVIRAEWMGKLRNTVIE